MKQRPKILVIAPDLPFPVLGGGRMRMVSCIYGMSQFAQVHIACLAPQILSSTISWANNLLVTIENFHSNTGYPRLLHNHLASIITQCNLRRHYAEQTFFDSVVNRFKPDLVWIETPYLLRYSLKWKNIPTIVDYWGTSEGAKRVYQNSSGLLKTWKWLQWRAAREGELRYTPLISDIVCVSKQDGEYFKRIASDSRIWPIPIGILQKEHTIQNVSLNPGTESILIFTGDLSYLPNVDAAIYFVEQIFPLILRKYPNTRFQIVGRNPLPDVIALNQYPNVEVIGYVPDLDKKILQSTIYVLPMRLGSGIRSKLFDVFPLKKPIISTSIGAEGLELYHNENCLIAETPEAFAAACVQLLNNKAECGRLGNAVLRLATQVYSQDNITRLIHQVITHVLNNNPKDALKFH